MDTTREGGRYNERRRRARREGRARNRRGRCNRAEHRRLPRLPRAAARPHRRLGRCRHTDPGLGRHTDRLDFFSIADHCSYPYDRLMTPAQYRDTQATANRYTQDGTFVTFWGFEWTSDDTSWGGPSALLGKGHVTVINSPDFCRATDQATNDLNVLVGWLSTRDVVAFMNQPGEYKYGFDSFDFHRSEKIVGMELRNENTDYFASGSWCHAALARGWRSGAEGSGDNHAANWGTENECRMAVRVREKTRAAVPAAMEARRFCSTRDRNLPLSFTIRGAKMGSTVPTVTLHSLPDRVDRRRPADVHARGAGEERHGRRHVDERRHPSPRDQLGDRRPGGLLLREGVPGRRLGRHLLADLRRRAGPSAAVMSANRPRSFDRAQDGPEHRRRAAAQELERLPPPPRLRRGSPVRATREGGLLDEPGQPFAVPQPRGLRAERLEAVANHLVQDGLGRLPWLVLPRS